MYTLSERQKEEFKKFRLIGYENAETIFGTQVEFVRKYHEKAGIGNAYISISGGIDSAYATAVAVAALGAEHVFVAKLPYDAIRSSIVDSVYYADLLVKYLNIPDENVSQLSILGLVNEAVKSIEKAKLPKPGATALGNLQARARMLFGYHIAFEEKALVHDTCNRTEILFGYLTKHGDGASDLNAIGGIYKTHVRVISEKLKLIPDLIVNRISSAELFDGQADETDMGMSYDILDLFDYLHFDRKIGIRELAGEYEFTPEIMNMILGRTAANAHKSLPTPVCKIDF